MLCLRGEPIQSCSLASPKRYHVARCSSPPILCMMPLDWHVIRPPSLMIPALCWVSQAGSHKSILRQASSPPAAQQERACACFGSAGSKVVLYCSPSNPVHPFLPPGVSCKPGLIFMPCLGFLGACAISLPCCVYTFQDAGEASDPEPSWSLIIT